MREEKVIRLTLGALCSAAIRYEKSPLKFGLRTYRPTMSERNKSVMPNPSLNHRTRYGGPSWPGLGYEVHFPNPGQAVPP